MQPDVRASSPRRRWRSGLAAGAVGVLAAGAVWVSIGTASAATNTVTVSVNAGQSLAIFGSGLVGANVAIWDGLLADPRTSTLLNNASVSFVRYPGGSYGDIYHWQTNTAPGGYVAPNTDFDHYMTMVRGAGAQPIIIANYGSGTPQEAADWVRYANVTKGYGVKYWEIGNEVYGNGHYGANWETDNHSDKSPRGYAASFLQYASAMKAVDPTIKIGVVLTTPGYWPDGIVGSGDSADWNDTVMSIVKNSADFGIFHYYPGGTSEADQLTKPPTLASTVSQFKADMANYATNNPGVFITETNSGATPSDTQMQALWAADTYLTAAESGVTNVDWWDVRNGAGATSTDVTGPRAPPPARPSRRTPWSPSTYDLAAPASPHRARRPPAGRRRARRPPQAPAWPRTARSTPGRADSRARSPSPPSRRRSTAGPPPGPWPTARPSASSGTAH